MSIYSQTSRLLEVPIRSSLWKSVLLAGADRRLTISVIGSSMVLILLSRFALWPCLTALIIATLGQLLGVKLASADPQMIDVYLRHIGFERLYSARSELGHKVKRRPPSIPKI